MKLRLLFFAAFLMLASCSGDDNAETINPPVGHKDLKEITTYLNDGDELADELRKFENNKIKERYLYNAGVQFYEDFYTYNENGLLTGRYIATTDDVEFNQTVNYDSQGRIIEIENITSYYEKFTFDYSQEGKIIATEIFDGGGGAEESQKIYELNSEGYIIKVKSGALTIVEYDYQEDNIIKYKRMYYDNGVLEEDMTQEHNYSYDMNTEVKGEYINVWNNLFGDSKTNYILYEVPSQVFTKNNYISAYTYNYSGEPVTNITVEYEFDADGFPVKQLNYKSNALYYWYEISYL